MLDPIAVPSTMRRRLGAFLALLCATYGSTGFNLPAADDTLLRVALASGSLLHRGDSTTGPIYYITPAGRARARRFRTSNSGA